MDIYDVVNSIYDINSFFWLDITKCFDRLMYTNITLSLTFTDSFVVMISIY